MEQVKRWTRTTSETFYCHVEWISRELQENTWTELTKRKIYKWNIDTRTELVNTWKNDLEKSGYKLIINHLTEEKNEEESCEGS